MTKSTLQRFAKVAGFMYLFAFIAPTLNWVMILSKFNVNNNALATANKIIADKLLFSIGLTIELTMAIGLIVLGFALFTVLKTINKNLALIALLIKLVEATISVAIVLVTFIGLQMLTNEAGLPVSTLEQLKVQLGLMINSHTAIFSIPMVFLGVDMIIFSYLFLRSRYIPRVLAVFGIISFTLILIHALMYIIAPAYAEMPINQIIFWAPSGLFEIIIGMWLLIKGINIHSKEK